MGVVRTHMHEHKQTWIGKNYLSKIVDDVFPITTLKTKHCGAEIDHVFLSDELF